MKRIAIFCDGTWNAPNAHEPTNVFRLYQASLPRAADGTEQLLKYLPGVGTGDGKEGAARVADKVVGGLFGRGILARLSDAYSFLAEHYVPGDEIYLFGFSRGAFTARSLAGMLRATALPPRDRAYEVKKALAHYTNRWDFTKPSTTFSRRFRLRHAPGYHTDPGEAAWRAARGVPLGAPLSIRYLGVWDTVGALGVPAHYGVLSAALNGGHRFHDTKLSRMVKAGRHAVSLDEPRRTFPPTLWHYDAQLSAEALRAYKQQWFPGDHGSVGGGGDIKGLSSMALRWIAAGARKEGLEFDGTFMARVKAEFEPTAALRNTSTPPSLPARLMRLKPVDRVQDYERGSEDGPRPFPAEDLSLAAIWRHQAMPDYRPRLFRKAQ